MQSRVTVGELWKTSLIRVNGRLDRQQRSRASRVPTVTVLAAPAGADAQVGARLWAEWLAQGGRSGSTTDQPTPDAAVTAWLGAVHGQRDVLADILAQVAREAAHALPPGSAPAELARQLCRAGPREHAGLVAALDAHGVRPALLSLCRHVLGRALALATAPGRPSSAPVMEEPGVGTWAEILAHTGLVIPHAELPGVALVAPAQADGSWVPLAAHAAERLAACAPEVPLALCAPAALLDGYLRDAGDSRAKALVRQGLVAVSQAALAGAAALATELAPSIMRLEALIGPSGAGSAGVVQSFWRAAEARAHAVEATGTPGAPEPARTRAVHQARSAAELLLFDALQAQPGTAGVFVLNRRLDWQFGSAPIEVDLVSCELRLAVEVDGYYHFRDADGYRRDRRKDLALQLHDYLVVRCLAEDVVVALGQVLDTIAGAVRARRRRQHQEE